MLPKFFFLILNNLKFIKKKRMKKLKTNKHIKSMEELIGLKNKE